jgi:hypothetical protein
MRLACWNKHQFPPDQACRVLAKFDCTAANNSSGAEDNSYGPATVLLNSGKITQSPLEVVRQTLSASVTSTAVCRSIGPRRCRVIAATVHKLRDNPTACPGQCAQPPRPIADRKRESIDYTAHPADPENRHHFLDNVFRCCPKEELQLSERHFS